MTLGVLESYRRCQVGSVLLQSIIDQSVRDGIDHIYLHVQTSNAVALQFYRKFGFEVTETIRNYYKRIEPVDCHVLLRKLRLMNCLFSGRHRFNIDTSGRKRQACALRPP